MTGTPLPHEVLADGPPTRRVSGHAPTMMSVRPPAPGQTGTGTEPDAGPPAAAIDAGTQPAGGATGTRPVGGVTGTQPVGSRRRRTAMMGAEAALGVPAAPMTPPSGRKGTQPMPSAPATGAQTGPIPGSRGTAPTMLLDEESTAGAAPSRRNIPPTSMPPPAPETGPQLASARPRLELPTPPETFRPSAPPDRPPTRLIVAGAVVLAIVAAVGLGGGAYLATLLVDEEDPTAAADGPTPPGVPAPDRRLRRR